MWFYPGEEDFFAWYFYRIRTGGQEDKRTGG